MACDGYFYAGKKIDRMPLIADLTAQLPTLKAVLILPYLCDAPDCTAIANATLFDDAIVSAKPVNTFVRVGFNDRFIFSIQAAQPVRQNALFTALAAL